jgi:hypothetical protein
MTTIVRQTTDDLSNCYVKGVTHAQDLDQSLVGLVDFGTPALADPDKHLDAVEITAVTPHDMAGVDVDTTCAYGRNLVIANASDADGVLTVYGRDYLNQPMSEQLTCDTGAATGKKAFKYIDRVEVATTNTIDLGTGALLGVPYTAIAVIDEIVDGVSGTDGTLVAAVFTDPATTTTGDTRGTYDPNATLDGAKKVMAKLQFYNDGEHGLLGVAQV